MKTTQSARTVPNRILLLVAVCSSALAACGGGHSGSTPQSTTYDLQAGYGNLITTGLTTTVTLSGTDVVNGTSVTFTGNGTLSYAPATSTIFDNSPALSQMESFTGTVSVAGQSKDLSTSVTDFYAPSTYAFLGESSTTGEYDVAQSPIVYPSSVVGGSSGALGTINRYTDSTMSVTLGTAQLSYTVSAPVDSGSPVLVAITNAIYDTSDTLVETDVSTFSLTTSNELAFVSATTQMNGNTLLISAQ